MIVLDVKSELPKGVKWTNEMTKQLPFSASQALNATVGNRAGINQFPEASSKGILADMKRLMNRNLDRPKKQTAEGFYATTAKKTALFVKITPKNRPWDRNRYIVGNIEGGDRPNKWIELEARKLGSIPSNISLVPTYNVKRDNKHGNPKRTQIRNAFKDVGSGKTFIGKPENSTRPFGIYSVAKTGSLEALFVAKSSTQYPTLLAGMENYAYSRASRTFGPYLRRALERNVNARIKQGKADLKAGLFS
tara:strand:+ start:9365 stop:10111 length:747 start_codon:yes stop_codon:yes gene_type:complete